MARYEFANLGIWWTLERVQVEWNMLFSQLIVAFQVSFLILFPIISYFRPVGHFLIKIHNLRIVKELVFIMVFSCIVGPTFLNPTMDCSKDGIVKLRVHLARSL